MVRWEKIPSPHYYAGKYAMFGPWQRLRPERMSYKAGYRWFRFGVTEDGKETFQFRKGGDA